MAFALLVATAGGLGGSALVAYIGSSIAQNVAKYFLNYDEFETEKIDESQLRDGDHIFVPGSFSVGLKMKGLTGIYHHGIYLGEINGKKMVTDFGSVNKTRPVIRDLHAFLSHYSNQLYRRNYKHKKTSKPDEIFNNAKLICEGDKPWAPYSLNTNNCEHYASLLKMSQVYSEQAKHLPQDLFYRQCVVPSQGKSILEQHKKEG